MHIYNKGLTHFFRHGSASDTLLGCDSYIFLKVSAIYNLHLLCVKSKARNNRSGGGGGDGWIICNTIQWGSPGRPFKSL